MNLADALAQAADLELARIDAQLLLLHALGRASHERAWLLAHDTEPLTSAAHTLFAQHCRRRAAGEPLAYIVGRKEFFGLDLMVDKRVLVPRPDTETLVQWALDVLDGHESPKPKVIDLGTGSGAIALAIKQHQPGAVVEALDASVEALAVARANADALNLNVTFRQASWLAGTADRYELILSNPPYVGSTDPHLADLTHEPLQALTAGPDGLDDIRTIIAQAPARLKPGGWLLLEHGYSQANSVRNLLTAAGFQNVTGRCDLAGIERCSGGKWLELG